MCGIIGAWFTGDHPDPFEAIEIGLAALAHRGPDDGGEVSVSAPAGGQIILGNRRLAILDLSNAGHQPMHDEVTGNWIAYNGEVYNFAEIRTQLESLGYRFHSNTDTEVLLKSYGAWGPDCVTRWRGMFAAAIWDASKQRLFIVRDRLGVKPLYYYSRGGLFIFSSEVRSLMATGLVPRRISAAGLDSFLIFGALQDPLTLVDGVEALPPASWMTISTTTTEIYEYWHLDPRHAGSSSDNPNVIEEVADQLEIAVKARLISDVPLGLFLSSGIDSNALARLMRRSTAGNIKAFTISFTDKAFDEAREASQTARDLEIEHHSILLTEQEMLSSLGEAMDALDQPSIDGINTYHVSRAVKGAGMSVALSGLGGDEVFCGYELFRSIPRMNRFAQIWSRLPFAAQQLAAAFFRSAESDRQSKLRALLLNDFGFADSYFLARTLLLPDQIAAVLERDAIASIDHGPWARRLSTIVDRTSSLDDINAISFLELMTYVPNTLLRDADAMSMAHSLEIRVPFLDHLLLERVMLVPGKDKYNLHGPKPLLLRSLRDALPTSIVSKPKKGFTLPFSKWLPGPLKQEVETVFESTPAVLEGIVNRSQVQAVWHSFLSGRCSWTRPWAFYVLFQVADRLFRQTESTSFSRANLANCQVSENNGSLIRASFARN